MSELDILHVERLAKRFVLHEREQRLQAFEQVSFTVRAGELVGLVGASGSGKSSILKCIYRTYLPTAGRINFTTCGGESVDVAQADISTVLQLRRTEIRFVSQFLRVLPRRSALQIVETALRENGRPANDCRELAREFLSRVGLPQNLWELPPNTFSGGEKQLVNMAQALAVRPRLLLLDEPTASLDPRSCEVMIDVIHRLKSDRIAIVAVFHDQRLIQRLADRTVELNGGLRQTLHPQESHE